VWNLRPGEKLALQVFSKRMRAQDVLDTHGKDMPADMLFDWVLRATGSRAAAEQAFRAKRKEELRSGQPVPTV
jgi:hypothetical protein